MEAKWCIYASVNWGIIVSDNGLLPDQRQAIIWTNAVILVIRPLGTNFIINHNQNSYIFIKKCIEKCHLENSSHIVSASMW